jgi:hypothetical protein
MKDKVQKNTKLKQNIGGMVQVVECMPSKLKGLSSNPNTTKIVLKII